MILLILVLINYVLVRNELRKPAEAQALAERAEQERRLWRVIPEEFVEILGVENVGPSDLRVLVKNHSPEWALERIDIGVTHWPVDGTWPNGAILAHKQSYMSFTPPIPPGDAGYGEASFGRAPNSLDSQRRLQPEFEVQYDVIGAKAVDPEASF